MNVKCKHLGIKKSYCPGSEDNSYIIVKWYWSCINNEWIDDTNNFYFYIKLCKIASYKFNFAVCLKQKQVEYMESMLKIKKKYLIKIYTV